MTEKKSDYSNQALLKEIQDLRADVSQIASLKDDLRRMQESMSGLLSGEPASFSEQAELKVFFEKVATKRKPYILRLDGIFSSTNKLSPIRAAIFLVLLLDLQDRSDGGQGIIDPLQSIAKVYNSLEGSEANDSNLDNTIRVALYRFEIFLKEKKVLANEEISLDLDPKGCRLVSATSNKLPLKNLSVQVITAHPEITKISEEIVGSSPLARARKLKAMFVPSGAKGHDLLFLELHDHKHPVNLTTIFFRPAIQSYPVELLEQIGASQPRISRAEAVLKGYASGRCKHIEIRNRETMWDMIRCSPEEGFKLYPPQVKTEQVLGHIDHIIWQQQSFNSYQLVLTDAFFPFLLASFEIKSGIIPEYFTIFYQHYSKKYLYDVSSFVIYDPIVYQGIAEKVVNWIIEHPTTNNDRDAVVTELNQIRKYLLENGPIAI